MQSSQALEQSSLARNNSTEELKDIPIHSSLQNSDDIDNLSLQLRKSLSLDDIKYDSVNYGFKILTNPNIQDEIENYYSFPFEKNTIKIENNLKKQIKSDNALEGHSVNFEIKTDVNEFLKIRYRANDLNKIARKKQQQPRTRYKDIYIFSHNSKIYILKPQNLIFFLQNNVQQLVFLR